jgi:hypothetical protein
MVVEKFYMRHDSVWSEKRLVFVQATALQIEERKEK